MKSKPAQPSPARQPHLNCNAVRIEIYECHVAYMQVPFLAQSFLSLMLVSLPNKQKERKRIRWANVFQSKCRKKRVSLSLIRNEVLVRRKIKNSFIPDENTEQTQRYFSDLEFIKSSLCFIIIILFRWNDEFISSVMEEFSKPSFTKCRSYFISFSQSANFAIR